MKQYTLVNIYGYNDDNDTIFRALYRFVENNYGENLVIGGDFNTIFSPLLDKKNGRLNTHTKCRKLLKQILNDFELADIWRDLFPFYMALKPSNSNFKQIRLLSYK